MGEAENYECFARWKKIRDAIPNDMWSKDYKAYIDAPKLAELRRLAMELGFDLVRRPERDA